MSVFLLERTCLLGSWLFVIIVSSTVMAFITSLEYRTLCILFKLVRYRFLDTAIDDSNPGCISVLCS